MVTRDEIDLLKSRSKTVGAIIRDRKRKRYQPGRARPVSDAGQRSRNERRNRKSRHIPSDDFWERYW